jgi:hypothetical protein
MQAITQELAVNGAFSLAIRKTKFGSGDQVIRREVKIQAAPNALHTFRSQIVMHNQFMFPAYIPSHEIYRGSLRKVSPRKVKEANFLSTKTRRNCTAL